MVNLFKLKNAREHVDPHLRRGMLDVELLRRFEDAMLLEKCLILLVFLNALLLRVLRKLCVVFRLGFALLAAIVFKLLSFVFFLTLPIDSFPLGLPGLFFALPYFLLLALALLLRFDFPAASLDLKAVLLVLVGKAFIDVTLEGRAVHIEQLVIRDLHAVGDGVKSFTAMRDKLHALLALDEVVGFVE